VVVRKATAYAAHEDLVHQRDAAIARADEVQRFLDHTAEARDGAIARTESQLIDHALREADLLARAERAEAELASAKDHLRILRGGNSKITAAQARVRQLEEALGRYVKLPSLKLKLQHGNGTNEEVECAKHARAVLAESVL
jgi:hypothetical protein